MANFNKEYSLIKINDKRLKTQKKIEEDLSSFKRHYINCVDGKNEEEIKNFFKENPNIKETRPLRYGYVGHWLTFLNALRYIVDNNIESLLILEDDAILSNTFIKDLETYMKEVPEDYDFFMVYQSLPNIHNCVFPKKRIATNITVHGQSSQNFGTVHPDWQIGSKYVVRTYQSFGSVGQIFSNKGAKKIIELTEKNGFGKSRSLAGSFDRTIYMYSFSDYINGYQPNPYSGLKKLITIENTVKNTDNETQIQGTKRIELDKILVINLG